PHKCQFCGVRKVEPVALEYDDFSLAPIIGDNNILATSWKHQELVVNKLVNYGREIDINSGFDVSGMDTPAIIYDKGTVKLDVEAFDPFLWGCLEEHLTVEFPEFNKNLDGWKRSIVAIVEQCHGITKTIAAQLAKMGLDAAEAYLSPDSTDYGPGIYYPVLTSLMYECIMANYSPQFQSVGGSHDLLLLVIEYPRGNKEVARGPSTLLDQVEQCCLDMVACDAIKKKVGQALKLGRDLRSDQDAIRQRLRLILERGTFKGTCQVYHDLI
ncbi:unnamed protein product, partial [marine sediment metagenome]